MLNQLKSLDTERINLEELVALSAFAKGLRAEFDHVNAEVPEWLDQRARELAREIRSRLADSVDKKLREAKARLEALKPADQKRAELKREILALEKKAKVV